MERFRPWTLCRAFCLTAGAAACLSGFPAVARKNAVHKVASGGMTQTVGPVDLAPAQTLTIAASAPRTCWDCSYQDQLVRQYRPGETVVRFQPIMGGSISYHF